MWYYYIFCAVSVRTIMITFASILWTVLMEPLCHELAAMWSVHDFPAYACSMDGASQLWLVYGKYYMFHFIIITSFHTNIIYFNFSMQGMRGCKRNCTVAPTNKTRKYHDVVYQSSYHVLAWLFPKLSFLLSWIIYVDSWFGRKGEFCSTSICCHEIRFEKWPLYLW